ncbi:MAG: CHAD domain-containing protein [Lewinellaceae bacterium]|nr:CHAD domain-containing protein [Lewinellaceae bacterium]
MSPRKRWRKRLQKQWNKIARHYRAFRQKGKPRDLHHLRIAGKKILAMGELLAACSPGTDWENIFQPLVTFNRQAGDLRTRYQTRRLLHQARPRKGRRARKKLKKHYRYWRNMPLAKIKKQLQVPSPSCQRDYYWQTWQHVQTIFRDPNSREEWHNARILLKTLVYNYPLLTGKNRQKIALNKPFLQKLVKALGDWHDLQIAYTKGLQNPSPHFNQLEELLNRQIKLCVELILQFPSKGMWIQAPRENCR